MKTHPRQACARQSGYLMVEALTYISVLFLVLGCAFAAMYRSVSHSNRLRLSADDIAVVMQAGERWRSEIRTAGRIEARGDALVIATPTGEIVYAARDHALYRQPPGGVPVRIVSNLKSATAGLSTRHGVPVWTWELELEPRTKPARIRPLFTFMAVHRAGGGQ